MANLLSRVRRPAAAADLRYSLNEYISDVNQLVFAGLPYSPIQTTYNQKTETIEGDFEGLVRGAYKRNGIVFACQVSRLSVFSQAPFAWRQMRRHRTG